MPARAITPSIPSGWTAPDGVRRPVRFSWQPVAGVRNIDPEDVSRDEYLFKELEDRLKRWPARFMLMMTIGEEGDALDDPTKPWPGTRVRVAMGTLTLTGSPRTRKPPANASVSIPAVSRLASKSPTIPSSRPAGAPTKSRVKCAADVSLLNWSALQWPSDEGWLDRFVNRLPRSRNPVQVFWRHGSWCPCGRD